MVDLFLQTHKLPTTIHDTNVSLAKKTLKQCELNAFLNFFNQILKPHTALK
jgi:hypothetical protein